MPPIDKLSPPFRLNVKAQPSATKDEVIGLLGNSLKVRVQAAPEHGKANLAIEKLLAKTLGLKKSQVSVVAGLHNPHKVVEIEGLNQQEIKAKLKL